MPKLHSYAQVVNQKKNNNKIEEFLEFEAECMAEYLNSERNDKQYHSDNQGHYDGNYEPERIYVVSILAFVHEFELDIELDGNVPDDNNKFRQFYKKFSSNVTYYKKRLMLRAKKGEIFDIPTELKINEDFKADIHSNLDVIRKIVAINVDDENKKDAIYSKIASLQFEVDRDRTSVDALFSRIIDLSDTLGKAGEKLGPAVDKLERVMKVVKDGAELLKLMPSKKYQQIEDKRAPIDELENEIPF